MATLVFSAESGPLRQVQIGPADVVSTISTAYAAAGWLGGFDGIKFILSRCMRLLQPSTEVLVREKLEALFEHKIIFQNPEIHILTSDYGPIKCEIPNTKDAFGGERSTQIIGLTLCALGHEGRGSTAVELFVEYLAPVIFEGADLIVDALQSHLMDNNLYQRILNEGATHRLPDRFIESVARLGLPNGDNQWLRTKFRENDEVPFTEMHMVAGLLRWIARGQTDPYFTRSGLVARVACYLKTVGYSIGSIEMWDGIPPLPKPFGPRSIVLVLGGSEDTDLLMAGSEDIVDADQMYHYTYNTVGSMLYHSTAPDCILEPEVLQTDFEYISEVTASRLQVSYGIEDGKYNQKELCAFFHWKEPQARVSRIERRLASIYFPLLADHIAPCYSRIATSRVLSQVLNRKSKIATDYHDVPNNEIHRFRTTTLAIILALAATLADSQFRKIRHCISITPYVDGWIEDICALINRTFSASIKYWEAVHLLAVVHTAAPSDAIKENTFELNQTIGWRNGIYSVLPSLLLEMKPSSKNIGLSCRDSFYANLRTQNEGSIRSSYSPPIYTDPEKFPPPVQPLTQQEHSVLLNGPATWVGPARRSPPSKPLYLNIERSPHQSEQSMCFVGRVDGTTIGNVSIKDVLIVLARSFESQEECSHSDENSDDYFLNVDVQIWADERRVKPVGTADIPAYLAVQDDPHWALFAAGQAKNFHTCIVTRCLKCSKKMARYTVAQGSTDGVVLVGYK